MNVERVEGVPFKICNVCETVWKTRGDFLDDPDISVVGYQTNFEALTEGLFLFNHSCRGTLSIKAEVFRDLYPGPVFQERMTGTEECPGYCLHASELSPCPAKCECAFVREILQMVRSRQKNQTLHEIHKRSEPSG